MNFLVFSLFFDTILACGDARVAVGAWSDGHQQQRGCGYIWSGASRASDASGLVHLLWHWYTPGVTFCDFLVRMSCFLTGNKVGSVGYVFS